MINEEEDEEILDEIRKDDEKGDFKSVINKKKVSKWELDEALISESSEA
jgi:hypothetical protein